jgi:hypothetical protein
VLVEPASGRWPEHGAADRMALAAGVAALAASGCSDVEWNAARSALGRLAAGVARCLEGPLPGGLASLEGLGGGWLAVEPWSEPPRPPLVTAEIVRTMGGLVPVLRGSPAAGGPVVVATLALVTALAADGDADERLRLALVLEGVLGWYTDTHRMEAPRHALAYAVAHAGDRLREAGREPPGG